MTITWNRRLGLPVAGVLGAGVLVGALGLPWSSASGASGGVRLAAAEGGGATLSVTDLDPGASVTRTVTVRNTTGTPARLSFTEQGGSSEYGEGQLRLVITRDGRSVFAGQFGAMGDFAQDMGFLEPAEATTFSFTVSLPDDADFVPPGSQTAEASYSWVTTAS